MDRNMSSALLSQLRELSINYSLSLASGDLLLLNGGWYVTNSGLLRLATRRRCHGIHVQPFLEFCNVSNSQYVFKATVYKSRNSRGFIGYGDAGPSNVSSLVHGAEMRVAETRAVNRALKKAYGIGICSVEEIGARMDPSQTPQEPRKVPSQSVNGNGSGRRVRDRLCQIIRQHQLDPNLVKSYATDFCGAKTLREASREQLENFVTHLADWEEKDRNALLCQLNSYIGQEKGAA
ncbi:MAG: hypothetical protein ACM3WP_11060 [Acidobacteriota bacterium]